MSFSEDFIEGKKYLYDIESAKFQEIDFRAIQEQVGLRFEKLAKEHMVSLLKDYIKDEFVWKTIPAKKRKQRLNSVIKACETLEALLSFGGTRWHSGDPELDEALGYTIWHNISPKGIDVMHAECIYRKCKYRKIATDDDVVKYLFKIRRKAEYLKQRKEKGGRSRNIAIRRFLSALHVCFLEAGGQKRGGWTAADGTNTGPFWVLATELLSHAKDFFEKKELPFEESNLLEYINEICVSESEGLLDEK